MPCRKKNYIYIYFADREGKNSFLQVTTQNHSIALSWCLKKHLTDDEKDYIASLLIVGITHIMYRLLPKDAGERSYVKCNNLYYISGLLYL